MFDFDFSDDWSGGIRCRVCWDPITIEQYRRFELCADCEFDKLTPPGWFEAFLSRLAKWKENNAHLFVSDEGKGYN